MQGIANGAARNPRIAAHGLDRMQEERGYVQQDHQRDRRPREDRATSRDNDPASAGREPLASS
jgi:hypothetical protein